MNTTIDKPETGLIKVEQITGIMAGAGEVLAKNEALVERAASKGQSYLDTIEGQGMSDELDAELNSWQVKAKEALEIMNKRRSPITQMMTQVAKVFTGLEAKIDPAKPESIYAKIQLRRNAWAKQKAEEQRAREQEILRQQQIEKEKIALKSEIERQIRLAYQNKVFEFKSFFTEKLNSVTLATLESTKEALKSIKTDYPKNKFYELSVRVNGVYIQKDELAGLIYDTRLALYDELSADFKEQMEDLSIILIDQIPSKKYELERIEKANAEEKIRLEREAEERLAAERIALQNKQQEAINKDMQKVELQKQIETTGNLFDTNSQLMEVKESTGQVRSGFKIEVTSIAGWMAIANYWFSKEAIKLNAGEIGKKTLDQMKAFCEKHTHKNPNEKLVHDHVLYVEEFKAIATRES